MVTELLLNIIFGTNGCVFIFVLVTVLKTLAWVDGATAASCGIANLFSSVRIATAFFSELFCWFSLDIWSIISPRSKSSALFSMGTKSMISKLGLVTDGVFISDLFSIFGFLAGEGSISNAWHISLFLFSGHFLEYALIDSSDLWPDTA